jgi:hypothetical protein
MVSSPLWDLWPDITFCPKVFVWKLLSCLCGAPSMTRSRVCYLSFSVYSNLSVFTSSINVRCVLQFSNLYTIYTKLHSVPSQYSRLCSVGWGDVDWIGLAQDRNMWRALVNSVLKLRVALTAAVGSRRSLTTCCEIQLGVIHYYINRSIEHKKAKGTTHQ